MTNEPPEGSGEFADFFHTDELPTGPLPRRSHRREQQRKLLESRLVAPLTAVGVVVVVILLLIWINGKPAGKGPGAGVVSAPTRTSSPQVSTVPSTRPSPRRSRSAAPATSSLTPAPSVTARSRVSATPSTRASATPRPVDLSATAPVQVLNNSTISGLAAHVGAELRAKHWKVTAVGNLQGVVAVTTVYYAAGERAAAEHLAHDFSSIRRVASAKSVRLPGHGGALTLVVTRDWSG